MLNNNILNVLFLESIFHRGGAENLIFNTVQNMNRDKFNPVFCTLYNPGPMGDVIKKEGYTFYSDLIRNKWDISAYTKLKNIIIKNKIDLIFVVNQPLTLTWGFAIAKIMHIPIISAIYNTYNSKDHPKLYLYKAILPYVDKIITVANIQKNHLIEKEKLPEHLVTVIHSGIDIKQFTRKVDRLNKMASLGLDVYKKNVGIVARLVNLKGIDFLLKAAKHVLEDEKAINFIIIGEGPERKYLEGLSKELGIQQDVHFLGFREDLIDLISIFDVAVLTSRTEALPTVILEYMASSKPVVSFDVGSVSELVMDGENGFLVKQGNYHAIAEKIKWLINNSEKSIEMGEKGRNIVINGFSIEKMVYDTEKLFEDIVNN